MGFGRKQIKIESNKTRQNKRDKNDEYINQQNNPPREYHCRETGP